MRAMRLRASSFQSRGVKHAERVDTDTQPVHGVTVGWERVEHGSDAVGYSATSAHVGLEGLGLLWRGQFLVEQQVNDVFGGKCARSALG